MMRPWSSRLRWLAVAVLLLSGLEPARAAALYGGDPCQVDSDGDGTVDCLDGCPLDPLKIAAGACGCGVPDTDTDGDGTANCIDGCPNDPAKIAPGVCGCGVPDADTDSDGTLDCNDLCPTDPTKIVPGACGCGTPDTDTDGDGSADCIDGCDTDPGKTAPGVCGCGVADTDTDSDGTLDCNDGCPSDPTKIAPGVCGCGTADTDTDGDGTANCNDGCPSDPAKTAPGVCGCGVADTDTDGDGTLDCNDGCPTDPNKIAPGACGCGVADTDTDGDGTANCNDGCPSDPAKTSPGVCGCGTPDTDGDGDGTPNCVDGCPTDPNKIAPGACGCGTADTDTDGDGTANCNDGCPNDPAKTAPGVCGCGTPDTDGDGDGTPNCNDGCPADPNKIAPGVCGCGVADTDSDGDGTPNCNDGCPTDPTKILPGVCGCGVADTDSDGDGTADCIDGCPADPAKIAPGTCGCGVPDVLYTFYRDVDLDTYGNDADTVEACTAPSGYIARGGDCNDSVAAIHPGAVEICGNQIDDDCDSHVDEGPLTYDRVRLENALPGNPPGQWDIFNSGDLSIQGFASPFSARGGQTIDFKIKTDATSYRLDIYRMGWYGGLGARLVTTFLPSAPLPQIQPGCTTTPSIGLVDCGTWGVSASWFVPCDAVSGVYVARIMRTDVGHFGAASHIHFVVRDDERGAEVVYQTADSTWQAYNSYGGASLYRDFAFGLPAGRAYKVSYNRPLNTRTDIGGLGQRSFFYNAEYPAIRFLERNGYDVSYVGSHDLEQQPAELLEHRAYISCGQNEYWSAGMRSAVEAARDAGLNLMFLSGNDVFWKVRFEDGIGGTSSDARTLVCYKETHASAKIDPVPGIWTGTWRDPRFSGHDGRRPENGLIGTSFSVNGLRNDSIQVPAEFSRLRFWRNTSVASLLPGQLATFPAGTLGFEWNEDVDNGFRPRGLVRLSSTTLEVDPDFLSDFGSTYGRGRATHALTLYKSPSGALVFSAGTCQWSWGLDDAHDRGPCATDVRMQQATVNMLGDMSVRSYSLMPGLVAAHASTDALPPRTFLDYPRPGDDVPSCAAVTVRGTSSDLGGGTVAGVEVSVDGGQRWSPAVGREHWTFTWMPETEGVKALQVRAIDDSGNVETQVQGARVNRRRMPGCPSTLFAVGTRPGHAILDDLRAVELGVRFQPRQNGLVHGIRFFKATPNPGDHQVHLWSSDGTQLAVGRLQGGPARGWQQVLFDVPVAVTANTTYVASFHVPGGGFPADQGFFSSAIETELLRAPQDSAATPNGVFRYGSAAFPTSSFASTNYWVDVVFTVQ